MGEKLRRWKRCRNLLTGCEAAVSIVSLEGVEGKGNRSLLTTCVAKLSALLLFEKEKML